VGVLNFLFFRALRFDTAPSLAQTQIEKGRLRLISPTP